MSTRRAPSGLGRAGKALWRDIHAEYGLAPHERAILVQCCRVVDRLDVIEAELCAADSLVVKGSTGQPKPHPLLAEWRMQRGCWSRCRGRCRFRCPMRRSAAGAALRHARRRYSGGGAVAWRRHPGPVEIPAWVWDDIGAAEVDAWLDGLYERDPRQWYEAFIEIISTPTYSNGSLWSPDGVA